jgi:DNA polymerase III epsilon subunit-like protein
MTETILALDLETSGLSTQYDQILQIGAAIVTSEGEIVSEFSARIQPTDKFKISLEALAVNGGDLKTEDGREQAYEFLSGLFEEAKVAKEVAADLRAWADEHNAWEYSVVAHNASFDWGFWANFEFQQRTALQKRAVFGHSWTDTMALARQLMPGAGGYGLDACLLACKLERRDAVHNALEDARLAAMLYFRLKNGIPA